MAQSDPLESPLRLLGRRSILPLGDENALRRARGTPSSGRTADTRASRPPASPPARPGAFGAAADQIGLGLVLAVMGDE